MAGSGDKRSDCRSFDQRQRAKYRTHYKPSDYDFSRKTDDPYFPKQAAVKLEEVRRHYQGGIALDLCCGAGHYTLALADSIERIMGIDFSPEMVRAAQTYAEEQGQKNVAFCVGNAHNIPLDTRSVALVYSFAALYTIPALQEVLTEIARVLKPQGAAILEFGALYSLNTLVCRATRGIAEPCHLPLGQIRKMLRQAGLCVERDRSFQILPLWGNRPLWLWPLLHPVWKRILSPTVGGRMLDEWISSLPLVRHLAFRHLMVCRKSG